MLRAAVVENREMRAVIVVVDFSVFFFASRITAFRIHHHVKSTVMTSNESLRGGRPARKNTFSLKLYNRV